MRPRVGARKIALAAAACWLMAVAPAAALPSKHPVWSSPIRASAAVGLSDGSVVLNGAREPGGVLLLGLDGHVVVPVIAAKATINAATADGAGGWVLAGSNGKGRCSHPYVTRVDASGQRLWTWSSRNDTPRCTTVQHVQRFGSLVVIAGQFTRVGGADRGGVAALDLGSGTLAPWSVDLRPRTGLEVSSLASDSGLLYLTGSFDHANGAPRNGVASVDGLGRVTAWAPQVDAAPAQVVPVPGRVLLVGAYFTGDEQPPEAISAVDPSMGARDPSWHADISNSVDPTATPFVQQAVAIGGLLYVAGDFDRAGGMSRRLLAALQVASGEATAWSPGIPVGESIPGIAAAGGKLVVATQEATQQATMRVSVLQPDTGALVRRLPAQAQQSPTADTLTGGGSQAVLIGQLGVSSDALPQLTRVYRSGREVPFTEMRFGLGIDQMALVRGRLILAGQFLRRITLPSGATARRHGLAAIDVRTGKLLPWAPKIKRIDGWVGADGRDIVFRRFRPSVRHPRLRLIRVDAVTGRVRLGHWITYGGLPHHGIGPAGATVPDPRHVLVYEQRVLNRRGCTFGDTQKRFVLRDGRSGRVGWRSAWLKGNCSAGQPYLGGADQRKIYIQNVDGRIAGRRTRNHQVALNRRNGRPARPLPIWVDGALGCGKVVFADRDGRVLSFAARSGRRLRWRVRGQSYGEVAPVLVPAVHGLAVLNANTRLFADRSVTPARCGGRLRD